MHEVPHRTGRALSGSLIGDSQSHEQPIATVEAGDQLPVLGCLRRRRQPRRRARRVCRRRGTCREQQDCARREHPTHAQSSHGAEHRPLGPRATRPLSAVAQREVRRRAYGRALEGTAGGPPAVAGHAARTNGQDARHWWWIGVRSRFLLAVRADGRVNGHRACSAESGMPSILRAIARVANRHDPRPDGMRERPECVMLDVRDGVTPNRKPPVRIFVGTEPEQYRAERVFVWSVERVRDPARVYEIHLMADLGGFDRRRWLTGFTNYRFAIPHFADGSGRAIYNDVDQIYLCDPAELFDTDMRGHGYLSITARDTSVMLIDCARMAPVWTLPEVQRLRRKRIEARTRAYGDLWAPLQPEWNARDEEYVSGRSKVLHYTTIHTQPWQPFPERYVYQHNPVGHVWLDLERAADTAHYEIFSAERPSVRYRALRAGLRASNEANGHARATSNGRTAEGLEALLAEARVGSVLNVPLDSRSGQRVAVPQRPGRTLTQLAAVDSAIAALPSQAFDAAVCMDALDHVPDEDIPWLIDALFRAARRCVYLSVDGSAVPVSHSETAEFSRRARSRSWWLTHVERASARYPGVHWKVVINVEAGAQPRVEIREGGRRADGKVPTVWVLKDHKAGHTTQSVGLAEALGFPYEVKALRFNLLNHLSNRLRGASRLGLDRRHSTRLEPPWPDLVVSTGRRTAPVARWIGQQSRGRARLVQLGRRGGETVDAFDLVVACAH